jgi:hypothetical protein
MSITKREAKALLGFKRDSDLARFFEIGRAAVHFWKDDEPIPSAREWELRARRPELFSGKSRKAA